jgi:hypothetical protein
MAEIYTADYFSKTAEIIEGEFTETKPSGSYTVSSAHFKNLNPQPENQLDRIEAKLDSLIKEKPVSFEEQVEVANNIKWEKMAQGPK